MPDSGRRKVSGPEGECSGTPTEPNRWSVDNRINYIVAKETRVTVCLVHGNPETAAVWDRLAPLLDRGPIVRLSPPGFGAPVPPGFTATVEEYRRWLVTELKRFERPVDLVGHDWGGAHVMNVVMTRPELVRSWVCDVIGLFDQDDQWHDLGQVWATPRDAERQPRIKTMLGNVTRANLTRSGNMPTALIRKPRQTPSGWPDHLTDGHAEDVGRESHMTAPPDIAGSTSTTASPSDTNGG